MKTILWPVAAGLLLSSSVAISRNISDIADNSALPYTWVSFHFSRVVTVDNTRTGGLDKITVNQKSPLYRGRYALDLAADVGNRSAGLFYVGLDRATHNRIADANLRDDRARVSHYEVYKKTYIGIADLEKQGKIPSLSLECRDSRMCERISYQSGLFVYEGFRIQLRDRGAQKSSLRLAIVMATTNGNSNPTLHQDFSLRAIYENGRHSVEMALPVTVRK